MARCDLLGKRLDLGRAARADHARLCTAHAVEQHAQLARLRDAGQQVGGDLLGVGVDAGHLHQRRGAEQGGQQHHRQETRRQLDANAQIRNFYESPQSTSKHRDSRSHVTKCSPSTRPAAHGAAFPYPGRVPPTKKHATREGWRAFILIAAGVYRTSATGRNRPKGYQACDFL